MYCKLRSVISRSDKSRSYRSIHLDGDVETSRNKTHERPPTPHDVILHQLYLCTLFRFEYRRTIEPTRTRQFECAAEWAVRSQLTMYRMAASVHGGPRKHHGPIPLWVR